MEKKYDWSKLPPDVEYQVSMTLGPILSDGRFFYRAKYGTLHLHNSAVQDPDAAAEAYANLRAAALDCEVQWKDDFVSIVRTVLKEEPIVTHATEVIVGGAAHGIVAHADRTFSVNIAVMSTYVICLFADAIHALEQAGWKSR